MYNFRFNYSIILKLYNLCTYNFRHNFFTGPRFSLNGKTCRLCFKENLRKFNTELLFFNRVVITQFPALKKQIC